MKHLADPAALLASLPAGTTVVVHTACAEPRSLVRALADSAPALDGVNVISMMPMGDTPYCAPGPASHLRLSTFFPGKGLRAALAAGRAQALRHPLSRIPGLFDRGDMKADVLLLQVSPPDEQGFVTLGLSVDYMRAVLRQKPMVIAEVNRWTPTTRGDTRLHVDDIAWFVDATEPPQEVAPAVADEVDERIATHVASLVRDGAVLQVGIGSLPDCVLGKLGHLKHLGLHSGVITEAVQPLIEAGVIDNSRKARFGGVGVTAMAVGTQSFYDFLDRNEAIVFHECSLTHDRALLAGIENLCAINSALQVDLAGNVNAETVDGRRISMPGGLPDFAAGSRRAPGGMSIVALRATFGKDRKSNIVASLGDAPVTAGFEDVDYVVTEFGIAALRAKSAQERARALIAVAAPGAAQTLHTTTPR